MIPLYKPTITGVELEFVKRESQKAPFGFHTYFFHEKCMEYFSNQFPDSKLFLTSSCSRALELSVKLLNLKLGDEVILPSFTYVASANAIVQHGGTPVFVDVTPNHPNINHELIEAAITERTVAIMPVHYAGVACEMEEILSIANKYNLLIIEDAAHGIEAKYKDKFLGGIGDFGCISFDRVKNISCGEGGLLIVKNKSFFEQADIVFENGTNRFSFLKGKVPYFQWVDSGSNYKLSTITAGFLFSQLMDACDITEKRIRNWNFYFDKFLALESDGKIELPRINSYCNHNAHIFYIKLPNSKVRNDLIMHLNNDEIESSFHFTPLHTSMYGQVVSRFNGEDLHTSKDSNRILRLPLYHQISEMELSHIVNSIYRFFG